MNHNTAKPIKRPSARKLQEKRAPLSALSDYQVGRCVRTWLSRNAGLLSIAIGWVFAFGMLLAFWFQCDAQTIAELCVIGAAFMGFGGGWFFRDGSDE